MIKQYEELTLMDGSKVKVSLPETGNLAKVRYKGTAVLKFYQKGEHLKVVQDVVEGKENQISVSEVSKKKISTITNDADEKKGFEQALGTFYKLMRNSTGEDGEFVKITVEDMITTIGTLSKMGMYLSTNNQFKDQLELIEAMARVSFNLSLGNMLNGDSDYLHIVDREELELSYQKSDMFIRNEHIGQVNEVNSLKVENRQFSSSLSGLRGDYTLTKEGKVNRYGEDDLSVKTGITSDFTKKD